MVSLDLYILRAVTLVALAFPLGLSAFRLRKLLLPGWEGAPARLIELIVGVALLIWLSELLGALHLLYAWLLIPSCVLLAGLLLTSREPRSRDDRCEVPRHATALPEMSAITIATVAIVFAHWGMFASYSIDHGISNFDSLWYHMPFAADIVQSHSVTGLHYTDTAYIGWFYSQNSELLHAIGILVTGRDTLSLFVNFGWLGVAFLAAWCIGRPYGRAPLTVIAAAILLECNTLIVRAPGSAKNDTMTIALSLAAIAILLNAWKARRLDGAHDQFVAAGGEEHTGDSTSPSGLQPGWAVAAAGVAAGLAVGTRVTVLPVVLALTVAVGALALPGRRAMTACWWSVAAFAAGGFWYLRNLVVAGNPLPQIAHFGPIGLPHPERLQSITNEATIVDYATDTMVWHEYFVPGLHEAFGTLWSVVVLSAIAGGLLSLFWSRDRALRWIGGVALLGILGYLATPLSAAGTDGAPFNFWINVRYALPALLAGLVLVPLARGFSDALRQWLLLIALLAILLLTNNTSAVLHDSGRFFGLCVALIAVGIPSAILLARRQGLPDRGVAASFVLLALLVVAVGYPLQRDYLRDRFAPSSGLPGTYLNSAFDWARGVHDARIGLAGTAAGFYQYGFLGTDLSNQVLYLGVKGPHGAFNAIPDCHGFRAAVENADLDYLVTSPFLNFINSAEPLLSPEAAWLRGSAAVEPISRQGPVTVWRVRSHLDPAGCNIENGPLHYVPQQPAL